MNTGREISEMVKVSSFLSRKMIVLIETLGNEYIRVGREFSLG